MKTTTATLWLALAITGLACSGCENAPAPTAAARPSAPPPLVTGRAGLQQMAAAARFWAADAQPLSVTSGTLPGQINRGGKAPIWQSMFVSAATGQQREFQYVSGRSTDGPPPGVNLGPVMPYTPTAGVGQPFQVTAITADSDQAYAGWVTHGGDELLRQQPKGQFFYVLQRERSPEGEVIAWDAAYGKTASSAAFTAHLNAATGAFLYAAR